MKLPRATPAGFWAAQKKTLPSSGRIASTISSDTNWKKQKKQEWKPDFGLISSRFYPDFLQSTYITILFQFFRTSIYPDFILMLSRIF